MSSSSSSLEELFASRIATIVPDVVGSALAGELRAGLEPGYVRYGLVDRGSYEFQPVEDPVLFATLAALATKVTGRTLMVAGARAIRLQPGDYLLAHHDQVHPDHPVELVLDLSAAPTPGAAVHYRRNGQVYFVVPSAPGSLAVVERGPAVTCNHTYVSKLQTSPPIVRLVMLLRDPPSG